MQQSGVEELDARGLQKRSALQEMVEGGGGRHGVGRQACHFRTSCRFISPAAVLSFEEAGEPVVFSCLALSKDGFIILLWSEQVLCKASTGPLIPAVTSPPGALDL